MSTTRRRGGAGVGRVIHHGRRVLEHNEAEATRAIRDPVLHDHRVFHRAVLLEVGPIVFDRRRVGQPPHEQLAGSRARVGGLPEALVGGTLIPGEDRGGDAHVVASGGVDDVIH